MLIASSHRCSLFWLHLQSSYSPLQSSMIGEFSRRFLRACALFRRCAAGIPDLAPVLDALSDVERRLEELGVEGRAILPGPAPSRRRTPNALYYRVRYLQEKNRKLEGRAQEFKKTELQSSNDLLDHAGRSQ